MSQRFLSDAQDLFVNIDTPMGYAKPLDELPEIPEGEDMEDDKEETSYVQRSSSDKLIATFGDWQEWHNEKDGVSYFFNTKSLVSTLKDPKFSEDGPPVTKVGDWAEWRDKNATYFVNHKASVPPGEDSTYVPKRSYSVPDRRGPNKGREQKRAALLRKTSEKKWKPDDMDNLHNELFEQMEALRADARKSGIKLPRASKKYKPVRAPPSPKTSSPKYDIRTWNKRRTQSVPADHRVLSHVTAEATVPEDESSDEKNDGQPKRALVRRESTDKWQVNDIEDLREDMMSELEMLQSVAVKSGVKLPRFSRKYKPVRTPPLPKESALDGADNDSITSSIRLTQSILPIPEEGSRDGTPSSVSLSMPSYPSMRTPSGLAPQKSRSDGDAIIYDDEYLWDNRTATDLRRRLTMDSEEVKSSRSTDNILNSANIERKRFYSTSAITSISARKISSSPSKGLQEVYIAISDYIPEASDNKNRLELKKGNIIVVHRKKSSGWWLGKNKTSGKAGFFPGSYVEACRAPSTEEVPSLNEKPRRKYRRMWSGIKMHDRSQRRHRSLSSLSRRRSTVRKKKIRHQEKNGVIE